MRGETLDLVGLVVFLVDLIVRVDLVGAVAARVEVLFLVEETLVFLVDDEAALDLGLIADVDDLVVGEVALLE